MTTLIILNIILLCGLISSSLLYFEERRDHKNLINSINSYLDADAKIWKKCMEMLEYYEIELNKALTNSDKHLTDDEAT